MPPGAVEAIAATVSMISIGSFVLIGMRMRLNAKLKMQQDVPREELDRLAESVENLHEVVRGLGDEMAELSERVEFAERLLTKGKALDAAEQREPTPV